MNYEAIVRVYYDKILPIAHYYYYCQVTTAADAAATTINSIHNGDTDEYLYIWIHVPISESWVPV